MAVPDLRGRGHSRPTYPMILLLLGLSAASAAQFGGIPPPLDIDPRVSAYGQAGMGAISGLAGVGSSGLSSPLATPFVNPYNSYASYPQQSVPNIFVINAGGQAKDRDPGWIRCPNFGLKVLIREVVTDMWNSKYGACSEARKTASEIKRRAGQEMEGKWAAIVIRDPMYSTCSYSFDHGGEVTKEDMEKVEEGEKANYCMLDIFGCHIFLRKVGGEKKKDGDKKKKEGDDKKKKDGDKKKKKNGDKKKKDKKKKKVPPTPPPDYYGDYYGR